MRPERRGEKVRRHRCPGVLTDGVTGGLRRINPTAAARCDATGRTAFAPAGDIDDRLGLQGTSPGPDHTTCCDCALASDPCGPEGEPGVPLGVFGRLLNSGESAAVRIRFPDRDFRDRNARRRTVHHAASHSVRLRSDWLHRPAAGHRQQQLDVPSHEGRRTKVGGSPTRREARAKDEALRHRHFLTRLPASRIAHRSVSCAEPV